MIKAIAFYSKGDRFQTIITTIHIDTFNTENKKMNFNPAEGRDVCYGNWSKRIIQK
jgi:hypothetical protein